MLSGKRAKDKDICIYTYICMDPFTVTILTQCSSSVSNKCTDEFHWWCICCLFFLFHISIITLAINILHILQLSDSFSPQIFHFFISTQFFHSYLCIFHDLFHLCCIINIPHTQCDTKIKYMIVYLRSGAVASSYWKKVSCRKELVSAYS